MTQSISSTWFIVQIWIYLFLLSTLITVNFKWSYVWVMLCLNLLFCLCIVRTYVSLGLPKPNFPLGTMKFIWSYLDFWMVYKSWKKALLALSKLYRLFLKWMYSPTVYWWTPVSGHNRCMCVCTVTKQSYIHSSQWSRMLTELLLRVPVTVDQAGTWELRTESHTPDGPPLAAAAAAAAESV